MSRFLSVLAMIVLMAPMAALAQGPADPHEWTAHPPIHVRGAATTTPTGYSPSQIRHAYGVDQLTNSGTGQIIAIIDAYDDPTAASDLQTFITQYHLTGIHGLTDSCSVSAGPHPCFQKTYAQGQPRTNSGWALEISLDVQWAHAIAPGADILLVEAHDAFLTSLLTAVETAKNNHATVASMSWGGGEFSTETLYDSYFNASGIVFTASSGDSGVPLWPAASPYVVGVGGTTLPLDANGNLTGSETAWSGSGGGISAYELEPSYQVTSATSSVLQNTGGKRGIPDVSYDADPSTGVSVYDSTKYQGQAGWFQVGGTSVGAPQWAALVALADELRVNLGSVSLSSNNLNSSPVYFAASTPTEYSLNYRDIVQVNKSRTIIDIGYDLITGLGSPLANNLVPYLEHYLNL